MAVIVSEGCIKCKYTDCVEVCPVDCFYEGENMLVINPVECIDCGICEPTCPVEAIIPDSHPEAARWVAINKHYSLIWPKITRKKQPHQDVEIFKKVSEKYPEHFSANAAAPSAKLTDDSMQSSRSRKPWSSTTAGRSDKSVK